MYDIIKFSVLHIGRSLGILDRKKPNSVPLGGSVFIVHDRHEVLRVLPGPTISQQYHSLSIVTTHYHITLVWVPISPNVCPSLRVKYPFYYILCPSFILYFTFEFLENRLAYLFTNYSVGQIIHS